MSASYEDFFPNILTEVPGAAEVVVVNAVRNACIEFCEKSLVLQRDHDPVTLKSGVVDYDLDPPKGYIVVKVMKAWLEDNQLTPLAPDFVREASVYNRLFTSYQDKSSTPQFYLQKDERSVSVWSPPDKDYVNGLTMRVALKPSRASEGIESVILEDYAETIASGALSRLMISVGKPYSNEKMAAVHRTLFQQGINVARQRGTHGQVRSILSAKLRRI
jgi:hypothetical protein